MNGEKTAIVLVYSRHRGFLQNTSSFDNFIEVPALKKTHTKPENDVTSKKLIVLRQRLAAQEQSFAREAIIEASLARIRARALAMKESGELTEVAEIMFREFSTLVHIEHGSGTGCWISIIDRQQHISENWGTDFDGIKLDRSFCIPQKGHPVLLKNYQAWRRRKKLIITDFTKKQFLHFTKYLAGLPDFEKDPVIRKAIQNPPKKYIQYEASFSHGVIGIGSVHDIEKEDLQILVRFAQEFELVYTRFLDLQKAETQAREAQIEAALERIRANALQMRSSHELIKVSRSLRYELEAIGIREIESVVIFTYHEAEDHIHAFYVYRHPDDKKGQLRDGHGIFDWDATRRARLDKEKYLSGESNYTIKANRTVLNEWYRYLEIAAPNSVDYDEKGKLLVPDYIFYNYARFRGGALLLITNEKASEFSKYILGRAANAFDLAYQRFLDLQKVEEQAREAQIEAGLERVRSRAIAMHNSAEVKEVVSVIHQQLLALQIPAQNYGQSVVR